MKRTFQLFAAALIFGWASLAFSQTNSCPAGSYSITSAQGFQQNPPLMIQNACIDYATGLLSVPNFAGSLKIGGGDPWFDVTAFPFYAKCNGTSDDTSALTAAIQAANNLPRGTVFIPDGKTCRATTLNLNNTTGIDILCGNGNANGRNTSGTGIGFTNTSGSLITAASSFSSTVSGCVLFPVSTSFNGTIVDLTASTTDTSNFSLLNSSVLSNGSSCNIGIDLNKSDTGHFENNFISGCVSMVRGFPTGSFSNVNQFKDGEFVPDATTTAIFLGAGDSFTVQGATFEMAGVNNTISLFDCTGSICSNPVNFGPGNWIGDVPATWAGTWFKALNGSFNIFGNVIGGGTAGTNIFLTTGVAFGHLNITGNRIIGNYGAFLNTTNTVHDVEISGNTYSSFSVVAGQFLFNGANIVSGRVIDNLDTVISIGTRPTISAGFGAGASIPAGSFGPNSFTVNTGAASASGTVGLPTAPNAWNCWCSDLTTTAAAQNTCKQTGGTASTAIIGNFTAAGASGNWVANDIVQVSCFLR